MTETRYPIIDSLCYVPTEEVVLNLVTTLPPQMARYLKDVFGPRVAPLIGMSAEELYRLKVTLSQQELAEELRPKLKPLSMGLDAFIAQMDMMGVEKAVIFNLDEETPSRLKGLPNDYYADIVKRYPERFLGIAGIDPLKGLDAYREVRRCRDLGLRGIAVRPFMFGIPPTHPRMYPLYAACADMDMAIWFHLSVNYSTLTMEVERPIYIDVVAQDFPTLKIIAGHGGWPWVEEMVAVAWRNPNVYIDFVSYLPRYLAMPGSGWEPLLRYGNTVLQDRILFGSTWLFMGASIKELADEVMKLPLKEDVKHKWLYQNALRLFGEV
jgi:predicted TIM-barrel fold metal-dependent hydrolase